MWMKSFTHMSCQCIGLLELIFSSSKTMPLYLQYGRELFASWPWHTPLTGLPDPNPSPINHPWNIRDHHVQDLYPSPAATLPELDHKLVSQWQCIPQEGGGVQMYTQAFSKHAQKGHRVGSQWWRSYKIRLTIYKFVIITGSCLDLFSTKQAFKRALLFLFFLLF